MKISVSFLVVFLTTNSFLVQIFTTKLLAKECPLFSSLIWEISSLTANCSSGEAYHCRVHDGQPTAFCHAVLDCPPGTFADLVKEAPSPKLQCVACPDDRFDASQSRSNEISECRYMKQKCLREDHKILWRPGSATSDNLCYCDYKTGFDMDADWYGVIPGTDIKICDGLTRCVCRPALGCNVSPNVCILPDKTCSRQCPPGFTRPPFSYKCVPKDVTTVTTPRNMRRSPFTVTTVTTPGNIPTSPFTVSPGNRPETPKPTEETLQNTTGNENWSPLYIVMAVLACVAVVLITVIILIIWNRSRQRIGQHQRVTQIDTQ